MFLESALRIAALVVAGALAPCAASEPGTPPTTTENHPVSLPDLTALDGSALPASTLDGKVVLFVNVASKCGFTPQYEGLQALYDAKRDAGLVIVGVPCNQFGWQEPGDADQIASFCKLNYGVTFPILEKQDVNGGDRSPLYQFLVGSEVGAGRSIKWNFEKFLVGRDGAVIGHWGSRTKPDEEALVSAIDAALAK